MQVNISMWLKNWRWELWNRALGIKKGKEYVTFEKDKNNKVFISFKKMKRNVYLLTLCKLNWHIINQLNLETSYKSLRLVPFIKSVLQILGSGDWLDLSWLVKRISYSSYILFDIFQRMTFATTFNYRDRQIFDLKTLLEAIRFIIVNFILAFIFLFLTFELFEWMIFSSKEGITDKVIDETSWNIKTLI